MEKSDLAKFQEIKEILIPTQTVSTLSITPPDNQQHNKELLEKIEQLEDQNKKLQERIKQLELEQGNDELDDATPLTGIQAKNQRIRDIQGMARIVAAKQWADNPNILISDMVRNVSLAMKIYCSEDELNKNTNTIKKWIRPVAPEAAKRKGRKPKTPK